MKRICFFVLSAFLSMMAKAQNSVGMDMNVDITKPNGDGGFLWLWIVGAMAFIMLLLALISDRSINKALEKKAMVRE